MNPTLTERIDHCLPQSQCRQCGFDNCAAYAEAIAAGKAAINLCPPGGNALMQELATLLNLPPLALAKTETGKAIAVIDETECIGCTACIKACPVDAIMGASKWMHTVLTDECTGCGLCLPPCPVDCIVMQPVADAYLPRAGFLADASSSLHQAAQHAKIRFQRKNQRLNRIQQEKETLRTKHRQQTESLTTAVSGNPNNINPQDLIAQAIARARAQMRKPAPIAAAQKELFARQQIAKAQERAAYRRALRDLQYGDDEQQMKALEYLREHKAKQEEAR